MTHGLGDDLIFAMRAVRRAPLLSLTIAMTLALGVAPNAATFSLVDRLLLRNRPLEVDSGARLDPILIK
ncbi:MAG: hypothetical protein M3081_18945 [Gemmatimonadota bacterium]|nr:hypothetical protein [Gemmatimonadota bacterium]